MKKPELHSEPQLNSGLAVQGKPSVGPLDPMFYDRSRATVLKSLPTLMFTYALISEHYLGTNLSTHHT